ncbi:MAG: glycosyl transferase [Flavobacteriales bacterium]|nr:TIGR04283 family arsenosugar biosynthesis glycosyltransferase [Bacteroidales bacterium AH-315-I05]PCJ89445.1 MAG: glycosyl transferase [Flavobacteriales bacterium]
MKISIVIPAYNEEKQIGRLVSYLYENAKNHLAEKIIVVDCGSKDKTVEVAERAGAKVLASPKGRAIQMNTGAKTAKGEVLYFVHADTTPPASFAKDILQAINEGYEIGCYRFKFNSDKQVLKLNSWVTRFDKIFFRGGDQTLFVKRKIFEELGSYDEKYVIMEEYDFIKKARKKALFKIMQDDVLVSARKYEMNSYLRVSFANFIVFSMFRLGASPQKIFDVYKTLIQHPKESFADKR